MARDPMTIIRALEAKTVANGCTTEEALSAKVKATEMRAKYGIDEPKVEQPHLRRTKVSDDVHFYTYGHAASDYGDEFVKNMRHAMRAEALRQAEAALKRGREAAAKVKPKPQPKAEEKPFMTFDSIGACAEHLIRYGAGQTYQQLADEVRRYFPRAKTSAASMAWYANKMKKDGRL